MSIKTMITIAIAAMLVAGCNKSKGPKPKTDYDAGYLKGDRGIYGLACDGSTDSVLLLLPNDGSDPVKYDIIDATRQHHVLGKIRVGDWVCVVPSKTGKHVGESVVDLDQLKGIWCYIVMPKMRDYDKMSKQTQARMMRDMPDSTKATYLIPREYGFAMLRQWKCNSVGYVSEQSELEEESPVVYPQLGYFLAWHLWNGKLIITSGEPKTGKDGRPGVDKIANDTCNIDFLRDDSLVLSSDGISRSYYKKDNMNDVNKRARKIAEIQRQKAIKSTTDD